MWLISSSWANLLFALSKLFDKVLFVAVFPQNSLFCLSLFFWTFTQYEYYPGENSMIQQLELKNFFTFKEETLFEWNHAGIVKIFLRSHLTSKLNYRWFPSYLFCTILLFSSFTFPGNHCPNSRKRLPRGACNWFLFFMFFLFCSRFVSLCILFLLSCNKLLHCFIRCQTSNFSLILPVISL